MWGRKTFQQVLKDQAYISYAFFLGSEAADPRASHFALHLRGIYARSPLTPFRCRHSLHTLYRSFYRSHSLRTLSILPIFSAIAYSSTYNRSVACSICSHLGTVPAWFCRYITESSIKRQKCKSGISYNAFSANPESPISSMLYAETTIPH